MIDSRPDTCQHIVEVQLRVEQVVNTLEQRAFVHDESKLQSPEVEVFDEYTPKLASSTYGSDEYKEHLAGMKVGLDHHYAVNDHHPEHHENGIYDMDLVQLMEMLCDWKAATMRHADGDLRRSIIQNGMRFGYAGQPLEQTLLATAEHLGWI